MPCANWTMFVFFWTTIVDLEGGWLALVISDDSASILELSNGEAIVRR